MNKVSKKSAHSRAEGLSDAICQQGIHAWYYTASGRVAASALSHAVARMSGQVFGYYALEMGISVMEGRLLCDSRISNCFRVATPWQSAEGADLVADPAALPIEFGDVDLVVAAHVLDCALSPTDVLREIERVLVPEGHCILIGFNPFSLRGLRWYWQGLWRRQSVPALFTVFRLRDWFTVLGFEVIEMCTVGYRERTENTWVQRIPLVSGLLRRYCQLTGNVQLIHVRKKVSKMVPLKPTLRAGRLLKPGIAVNTGSAGKTMNEVNQCQQERAETE